ncbi:FHA domain-containing protein [Rhizobium helianthi]|uniref:FHA domain-containing protein n=1 Tax=Rhizobium helianthi TaxID=1132695 RepID=A0ABW4M3D5_9HYPH
MHLELVLEAPVSGIPDHARAAWVMERGRRSLGRASDCDLSMPFAGDSVSPIHCVIERQDNRFVLQNRSPQGASVDGQWLHEGETAIIRDQSLIDLGNLTYRAFIRRDQAGYQSDPRSNLSLSSEQLTISAILSDVVPAGQMASGPLGPREVEDPLAFIKKPKPGTPTSRNVEIGWSGPPDPQSDAKLLPDNWWEEEGADTQLGHSLEHGLATRVSVGIGRAGSQGERAERAKAVRFDVPEGDAQPVDGVAMIAQLDGLVRQLQQAVEQSYAAMKLPEPKVSAEPFDGIADDGVIGRLESILARQLRLNEAIEGLFSESARFFDPRLVEVRAEASLKPRFGWLRQATYWRYYSSQFDRGGQKLSTADVLRRAYLEPELEDRAGASNAPKEGKIPDEV